MIFFVMGLEKNCTNTPTRFLCYDAPNVFTIAANITTIVVTLVASFTGSLFQAFPFYRIFSFCKTHGQILNLL